MPLFCLVIALDDAVTSEDDADRSPKALAIHSETVSASQSSGVFAIVSCLFGDRKYITAVDLCPAGDSGLYVVCTVLFAFLPKVCLIPERRSGAHARKLANKNLKYLRQFVDTRFASESPDTSYVLIRISKQMRRHVMRSRHLHAAELPDHKICRLSVLALAKSLLLEKHRTWVVDLDSDSYYQHRDRQQDDSHGGQNDI